jgi:hypothetical protein
MGGGGMSTHWSLGVLVGLPIMLVLTGAALVTGITMIRKSHDMDDIDGPFAKWGGLAIVAAAVITLAVAASPAGYYPYSAEYHQWRPVSGTVTQVSSRIISDGSSSVSQRFVVKIKGRDSFYGCDDTRCSTIKPGDTVHLSCKREWQYASVPGYGCRWAS